MVERLVHTEEVTGSMPVSPTTTPAESVGVGSRLGLEPIRVYGRPPGYCHNVVTDRLCERPGCSDGASVAYGMQPEDLVFWLDQLDSSIVGISSGGLCQRHADTMVVPRSWTLDDRRDPDLHLFRPPAPVQSSRRARRTVSAAPTEVEQLAFGVAVDGAVGHDAAAVASAEEEPVPEPDVESGSASGDAAATNTEPAADAVSEPVEPWSPEFDSDDDLNGLLSAHSPLLARAFRGDHRARGQRG